MSKTRTIGYLGARIRTRLADIGKDPRWLAERTGKPISQVYGWLRAEGAHTRTITMLCAALDVPASYLIPDGM